MKPADRRRPLRIVASIAIVVGGLALVPPGPRLSAAASEQSGFRIVGKVPVLYDPAMTETNKQSPWLLIDPSMRRGYQFIETLRPGTNINDTVVHSFDLDTLQWRRKRRIAGLVPLRSRGADEIAMGIHAVDATGGRLFLPMADALEPNPVINLSGGGADSERSFVTMLVIDEELFDSDASDEQVFSHRLSHPTLEHQAATATHSLRGMRYDGPPGEGKLLMLWADWTAGPLRHHQLMQWGVDRPAVDSWTAPTLLTQACGRHRLIAVEPSRHAYPLGILRGPDSIALACTKSDGSAQILRMELNDGGKPESASIRLFSLGRRYSDTIADTQGQRLLVRTEYLGNSWWVWDAKRLTWAGVVGVVIRDNGSHTAAGVDPTTGRLYTLAPNYYYPTPGGLVPAAGGLGYADTRLTPAPQLRIPAPELAYPGVRWIAVDPEAPGRPRRLFLRRGKYATGCVDLLTVTNYKCPVEDHWLVLEDREPVALQPSGNEVDRYTTDVDEQQGVTAANFDRSAAGFGARMLLISGVSGATARNFDDGATGIVHRSSCPPADREVVMGQVVAARAGNVAAAAEATALHADPTTVADAADPVKRCWPAPKVGPNPVPTVPPPDAELPGVAVASASASCTGDSRRSAPPLAGPPAQEAEADCGQATGSFEARAAARGTTIGGVTVGEAASRAWLEDDAQRGRVVRAESVARNVVLGDLGSIGLVRVRTAIWAGGRTGTAGSEFTRELCGVALRDLRGQGCLAEDEQQRFVDDANRLFAGNAELRLREPDADLAAGSPGGYQAAVQRAAGERFVDTTVTRDHSKVVPGLEVIMYRDTQEYGPARQIVQLAGVEASSQYGIYCLFGPAPSGKACNTSALGPVDSHGEPTSGAEAFSSGYLADAAESVSSSFESAAPVASSGAGEDSGGNPVARLLRRLAQVPADVLRLIASGPAELLLTAGMWLLLWLPCCVFERRRAARRVLRGAPTA